MALKHKFVSNIKGDVFCEWCGIVTFSRSMTGNQMDENQEVASGGCLIGGLEDE